MHLHYDLYTSTSGHPQEVMRRLGIVYQHATPQSISDSWWFWNCENIPTDLPSFIRELKVDPMDYIGHGLSLETAERINDYEEKSQS